ncbi:MAG TPA: hypothetical protein VFH47_01255, partial [Candidatus Thermoplasmatota archaeon]|nr:hypothetical protein [Candidatus Thermoplasmatota archaeon]
LLVPVNQFQITQRAPEGMVYFPHDTYVEGPTAARNQTLLYVSYWDKGLRIVDFSDPAKAPLPELQGFTEFGPSSLNAIHFARPFDEPIAGLHVTVTEPEVVAADETGQITFLDTTDLSRPPQKLGHWKLPPGHSGDLFVSNLDFSPHNFDVWDGKVALAHYHAGLWVIDVSDEDNLRSPRSVAFTMEVKERQDNTRMQPWFWGVLEHDGLLYASDEGTGLYVYRYTGP